MLHNNAVSRLLVKIAKLSLVFVLSFGIVGFSSFSPTVAQSVGQGLWTATAKPKLASANDYQAVELGTKFKSNVGGLVTGIRFYKGPGNNGLHRGSLWTADGKKIASVDFAEETTDGWQTVNFALPVNIAANTTYIVSYYAPNGGYSADNNYFLKTYTSGALTAGKNAGVYKYSATSTFPNLSYAATNYWVDVNFVAGSVSPIVKPLAPANFLAVPKSDGIDLSWTPSISSNVAQNVIIRDGTQIAALGNSVTSYKDKSVVNGVTYKYQIKSISATGINSDLSASVSATATMDPTTPPPSLGNNCALQPSACGFPDETNSGVPAGVVLRTVGSGKIESGPGWHFDNRGWVTVDGDGAVLDGLDVPYNIDVNANNVTIKNSKITASGDGFGVSIRHASNTVIKNSSIYGPSTGQDRLMVGIKDIYADSVGTQVLQNNIYHVTTGVQLESGLIADNYIHDMGIREGDHINGTTSNGGTDQLDIRHNTIFNQIAQTDAISLFEDFGVQANRTIDNNLIAGGSYSIYAGQNPGGLPTYNIKITNNRYAKKFFAKGGEYGPYTGWLATGRGNIMSGNVWDDTGLIAE